jgi:ubiquinone/menaquinone biosynthesis C-methylase UbiE
MNLAMDIWPFKALARAREASEIPLTKRLHAWWEGYELPASDEAAGNSQVDEPLEEISDGYPKPDSSILWSEERRKLVQILWGQGFTFPGGVEYACELVSGFSLNPAVSMVEVGAGMGGGTRAIVEKFKAYVDAYEIDEDLAREGMMMSKIHSVNDKAPVQQLDIKSIDLKDQYYEGALIRDMLYTIEDKKDLVQKVVRAIKPQCQIVVTDLIRASDSPNTELKNWMKSEPEEVHLWSVDEAQKCLASVNVLTRITADESDEYRTRVLSAWSNFLHRIETHPLGPELTVPLVDEVEMWARRIAAIDSGELRYYRFLGVKGT